MSIFFLNFPIKYTFVEIKIGENGNGASDINIPGTGVDCRRAN
jgi:hypothetical protein